MSYPSDVAKAVFLYREMKKLLRDKGLGDFPVIFAEIMAAAGPSNEQQAIIRSTV